MKKSILITGCSSGIGYDAAQTLHKRGWQVFAACRAQADCDRLTGEGLTTVLLNYENEATIPAVLDFAIESAPKLGPTERFSIK